MKDNKYNMMKVLIQTQYKEWYGCEDNVGVEGHGRYKNKGGYDFVALVDEHVYMYDRQAIEDAFNMEHNKPGSYTRCEILDIQPCYRAPEEIVLDIKSGVLNG